MDARSARNTLDELFASPRKYFYGLDDTERFALFADVDEAGYRESSFFDQRLQAADPRPVGIPLDVFYRLFEAGYAFPAGLGRLGYLFHVGHCGSSLVSRLIQALGQHAIREPLILKTLAAHKRVARPGDPVDPARMIRAFSLLARRTWRPGQTVVVKPSSYCVNLIGDLLEPDERIRALWLAVAPETYVATMLSSEPNRGELRFMTEQYFRHDFRTVLGLDEDRVRALTPGETAAAIWLVSDAEVAGFEHRLDNGRILRLDFDTLLADVPAALERIADFYGFAPAAGGDVAAELARYAKGDRRPFSPADRAAALARSREANRDEIGRAAAFLAAHGLSHASGPA